MAHTEPAPHEHRYRTSGPGVLGYTGFLQEKNSRVRAQATPHLLLPLLVQDFSTLWL